MKPKLFTNLFDNEMFLKDVAREGLQPQYQRDAQDYLRGKKIMPDVSDITQMKLGRDVRNYDVRNNQNRMQQWAGGPVKQQNKLEKNYYMDSIGKMPRRQVTNMYDHGIGYDGPYNEIPTYEMYDPNARLNNGRFQNSMDQTNKNPNGYVGELYEGKKSPKWISQDSRGVLKRINRLAGPIGALPMVAPEAVGMIGAAQEAQQRGVNPMVNWLQRMTPVPVVAPTGNGGEVYNYQSGERYTPMY